MLTCIISAFIRGEGIKEFPHIKILIRSEHIPTINLLNDEREIKESYIIDSWNTETIADFFRERLIKA